MATDTEGLIPLSVVSEIIESIGEKSVAVRLGRSITMPTGAVSVPVVSVIPQAEFVASGARKPVSQVEWSAERLEPEEIGVICWVPQDFVSDAGFDVEGSVQTEIAKAIARRLDEAILFGDTPPPSYPPNGLVGAGTPISKPTASEALNAGFAAVEADGLEVTGIAAGSAIGAALRNEYAQAGALPGEKPSEEFGASPSHGHPSGTAPRATPSSEPGRTCSSASVRRSASRPPRTPSCRTRRAARSSRTPFRTTCSRSAASPGSPARWRTPYSRTARPRRRRSSRSTGRHEHDEGVPGGRPSSPHRAELAGKPRRPAAELIAEARTKVDSQLTRASEA